MLHVIAVFTLLLVQGATISAQGSPFEIILVDGPQRRVVSATTAPNGDLVLAFPDSPHIGVVDARTLGYSERALMAHWEDGSPALGTTDNVVWIAGLRSGRAHFYTWPEWILEDSLTIPLKEADGARPFRLAALRRSGEALVEAGAALASYVRGDGGMSSATKGRVSSESYYAPAESSTPIWRVGGEGVIDTLVEVSTRHRLGVFLVSGPPKRALTRNQPFRDDPLVRVNPSGRWITLVERQAINTGNGRLPEYRIILLDSSGDTLLGKQISYQPVRLTDEWVSAAHAEIRSSAGGQLESLDTVRTHYDEVGLFVPDWLPPVSDVRIGPNGWMWIARESVPGRQTIVWEVRRPDGELVHRAGLPTNVRVMEIHERRAWGVARGGQTTEWLYIQMPQ